jgi:hypothetical protein
VPRPKRTQPVAAPQDQGYGQRGEQMAAQHAVPLPDNRGSVSPISAAPSAPPPVDMATALAQAQAMDAPNHGGLLRPTEHPDEPITAGLSTGPGPGPRDTGGVDPVVDTLRAAVRLYPEVEALVSLLEKAEAGY